VFVADGTYNQCSGGTIVDINTSGTPGSHITFQSQNKWGAKLVGDISCEYGFTAHGSFIDIIGFDISGMAANSAQGVYLASGTNHTLFGNNIHNIGNIVTGSSYGNDCIFVQTTNDLIDSNFMFDCGRTGGHSPTIDHGIYADGASSLTIQNNVIVDIPAGWCIQLYPGAQSNVLIINNTLNSQNSGAVGEIVAGSPLSNSRIANNLFYAPATAAIDFSLGSFSGVTVDHNLTTGGSMGDTSPSGVTFSSNITGASTSGLVVNPAIGATGDYHLVTGSPAIGAGTSSSAPSTDVEGTSRSQLSRYDVGAYEYPH
jgi:hypothetical protein